MFITKGQSFFQGSIWTKLSAQLSIQKQFSITVVNFRKLKNEHCILLLYRLLYNILMSNLLKKKQRKKVVICWITHMLPWCAFSNYEIHFLMQTLSYVNSNSLLPDGEYIAMGVCVPRLLALGPYPRPHGPRSPSRRPSVPKILQEQINE